MTATEAEARLSTHWAWVIYRGVVAFLFGLLAFARPAAATLTLVLAFGGYAFVGGVAAIATALRPDRARGTRDLLLLDGLVGVSVAALSLRWPERVAVTSAWIVGAWAVATGALELANA